MKFSVKRVRPKILAKTICHFGKAKTPIIFSFATNLINGTSANGSYTLCKMFK